MQTIVLQLLRLPLLKRLSEETLMKLFWYTLIGIITFIMTNALLFITRRLLELPDILSVAVTYALVTVCHFLLHNNLTFKESGAPLRNKISGHFAVSITNYFIGVVAVMLTIKFVIDNNLIATALSTVVTFIFGFTVLNKYVYKLNNPKKTEE